MQPRNIQTCFEYNYCTVPLIHVSGMCLNLEAANDILLQFFEARESEQMMFVLPKLQFDRP